MKSLFLFLIIGLTAVAADTTPLIVDNELALVTTPPAINNISIDGLLEDDNDLTVPTTSSQKNKQQQIQKHVQENKHASDAVENNDEPAPVKKSNKIGAPTAGAARAAQKKKKSIQARHMVCSVVVGSLICYSVNQDDITFDASECVVAPIPDNADGKNYTICSRSLI